MKIKVLGSGCTNCKRLYENTKTAVNALNVEAEVEYVTDYKEIAKAGLLRTPGLVIDGKVVSYGRVLNVEEIAKMISERKKR